MVSSTVLAVQEFRSRKAEMEAVVHTNCLFERMEIHDFGIGKIRKKKKQACPQAKKLTRRISEGAQSCLVSI
jgi:hypothetical protein